MIKIHKTLAKDRIFLAIALTAIASIGLLTIGDSGVNWDELVNVEMVKTHLEHVWVGRRVPAENRNHGFIFHLFAETIFQIQNHLGHFLFSRPLYEFLPIDNPDPDRFLDNRSLLARLQFKHILVFLTSLFAYFGVAGIVRNVVGAKFSFLAVIILALFPAWWGQTYFNQKDIPFASAFTIATFFGAVLLDRYIQAENESDRGLIRPSIAYGILLGIVTGLRIAGCFSLFFFVASHFLLLYPRLRQKTFSVLYSYRNLYGLILVYWALTTLLVYPASWYHSLTSIGWFVQALLSMSKYQPWDNLVLFDGQTIPGKSLPWYYLPKTFLLTTPSLFSVLFSIGSIGAILKYRSLPTLPRATLLLVGWQIAFLPLLAIVRNSTLYDGIRHFLFIIPPIAAIVTIAIAWIYQSLSGKFLKLAATALLIISLSPIVLDMIQLHPYQYLYYNRFSGGLARANERYETDYWGLSVREGIEWLNHNAPPRSRIVVTGPLFASELFADPRKSFTIEHLDDFEENVEPNPDYYLGLHRSGYARAFPDCSIVHEVRRQEVPLTTIKACPSR